MHVKLEARVLYSNLNTFIAYMFLVQSLKLPKPQFPLLLTKVLDQMTSQVHISSNISITSMIKEEKMRRVYLVQVKAV